MNGHRLNSEMAAAAAARGATVIDPADASSQVVLDAIRQQRRNHAGTEQLRAEGQLAEKLARELVEQSGLLPGEVSLVLLVLCTKMAALAICGVDPVSMANVIGLAADDLDRAANAPATFRSAGRPAADGERQ